jgi:hypothetical protein
VVVEPAAVAAAVAVVAAEVEVAAVAAEACWKGAERSQVHWD